MQKTIKIGDKNVPMISTAATDFFYRQLFHEDPTRIQYGVQSASEDESQIVMLDFLQRMGYIMARNVDLGVAEMAKLSMVDFYEWLVQFDRADYLSALTEIRSVYEGQDEEIIEPKKNPDEQSEK